MNFIWMNFREGDINQSQYIRDVVMIMLLKFFLMLKMYFGDQID